MRRNFLDATQTSSTFPHSFECFSRWVFGKPRNVNEACLDFLCTFCCLRCSMISSAQCLLCRMCISYLSLARVLSMHFKKALVLWRWAGHCHHPCVALSDAFVVDLDSLSEMLYSATHSVLLTSLEGSFCGTFSFSLFVQGFFCPTDCPSSYHRRCALCQWLGWCSM